jgi:uncharacterized repeat protein (TIGR03803 family)
MVPAFRIVLISAIMVTQAAQAQTFTKLYSFFLTDNPSGALFQGTSGDLYGTTQSGGSGDVGSVFEIGPGGGLITLQNFQGSNGNDPVAGVIEAANGKFYGTTYEGGANSVGSIFQISNNTLVTLYSFCTLANCTDGSYPEGALIQAANGDLYGTTASGGTGEDGTVFKINPSTGLMTTLYSFCSLSGCNDGAFPYAGLIQGSNGDFYGTTQDGGASSEGVVFKITSSGKLTVLYSFCALTACVDGANPSSALIQGANGDFYGTTNQGGANGDGTVFSITPSGTLTTLHSFDGADGANPVGALVLATDGNFYGTTQNGGANVGDFCEGGCGTLFKITPGGTLTRLHSFRFTDGAAPYAGLIQATNGDFYGTAYEGGENGDGAVYSLSMGLGPFVHPLTTSGTVGAAVVILGNNLSGATLVTFNGTAATFTVVSASEIKATVPTGATTGTVEVVTPGATLNSNVVYTVKP